MLLFRCTTHRRLVRPSSARRSQALYRNEEGEFGYEASGKPPVVSPMEPEQQARATERAAATKPYNPGESDRYFKSGPSDRPARGVENNHIQDDVPGNPNFLRNYSKPNAELMAP
jgi:hypothetical protein